MTWITWISSHAVKIQHLEKFGFPSPGLVLVVNLWGTRDTKITIKIE